MQVERRDSEYGGVMPLYAYMIIFLVMPLMAMTFDVTRYFYVRTHLQAASDAACEAAAQALDVPYFLETGIGRIDLGMGYGWGQREFNVTVDERALGTYSPAITDMHLVGPRKVSCTAIAEVPAVIPITPVMEPEVYTVSELRVSW